MKTLRNLGLATVLSVIGSKVSANTQEVLPAGVKPVVIEQICNEENALPQSEDITQHLGISSTSVEVATSHKVGHTTNKKRKPTYSENIDCLIVGAYIPNQELNAHWNAISGSDGNYHYLNPETGVTIATTNLNRILKVDYPACVVNTVASSKK